MRIQAAPRWAISFADLGLILLGCFVMLHAIEAARPRATAGSPAAASGALAEFRAADLFEPGEARLSPPARARLQAVARSASGTPLLVLSRGTGEGGSRLDRFELAAARGAAVARTLGEAGITEDRITVRVEADESRSGEARILVLRR